MSRLKVGVLRGGISEEYDVSLKTGGAVLAGLNPGHYEPIDMLVTKDGNWHYRGLPIKPADLVSEVDVVFNCLHGKYGEDGQVSQLLTDLQIPYIGSTAKPSAIAFAKDQGYNLARAAGVKTPFGYVINSEYGEGENLAPKIFSKLAPPWLVKPNNSGSSFGVTFVRYLKDLGAAIDEALRFSDTVIIEEYIKGQEVTIGVIDNFRNEPHYTTLPVGLRRKGQYEVYDYDKKYNPDFILDTPAKLLPAEKEAVKLAAQKLHQTFDLKSLARFDFIISPRGLYFLEVNTLPALDPNSTFIQGAEATGIKSGELFDHLITQALN